MSEGDVEEDAFRRLALEKMSAVLGASRAEKLLESILASTGGSLETADDLFAFATELARYGGFEGAVGGLLSVQAVLHGGKARPAAAEG